ncbi:alpha/beta hydrolase [Nonomuraea sp. NPDC003804]|uniref:alpha/beta hydrolase n=1 Tax=Nonomuraea sp. NPDC003804 TaxID=3154547 RepID=UPI0033AF2B74
MVDHAAASDALRRVTALAADHHTALDAAARLMQAHAWVGGGAPSFTADLARHRATLQAALQSALDSLAHLVVRQGGPPPAIPALSTRVTTMTATPGGFQGIDPNAMTALLSTLDHGSHTLATAGTRLSAELSAHGLSPLPGHTIGQVAAWAATQTADLRRRLTRIRQTVPGPALSAGVTAYDLFGAHATDPLGSGALLTRIAAGEQEALAGLLAVQRRGQDPGLAARVNAWWQTLTPDLRRRLTGLAGAGLLNGLPATVRDQSNRRWLTTEKARLTRELAAKTAELARLNQPALLGDWERTANQLRRLELVEHALRPVPGHPAPLFLAFDLTGQGRLVVSWGDPDTADTTVTSVSGLTSGLDGALGDLDRSRALWSQASRTSGDHTIASITWLGYDAPQIDPGLFDAAKSVALDNAAINGAPALASFTDGLRASHTPSGTARSVVVGHSYGSLTTGHAARLRPGRFADELIFVGSPGVGVDHAAQLGVKPEHVWVGEAGNDPVAILGRFGTDPGEASFGARRFPVGRVPYTAAHSCYWDQDSVSLINMGHIINGDYDKVISPEPLHGQAQLLMPEVAPDVTLKLNR